ncbi:MAG: glycosyltransferase [Clostridiales bacterium]|nr:glycosyltransferase [Clostridiales bacterium]
MKKVCVLISTYNGEKYIEEQLESINRNCSENVFIQVYIRDDGSTDKTVELVTKMSSTTEIDIKICSEENIGVQKSYLKLLKNAPEADFYFLCDQDDMWCDNKVNEFLKISSSCLKPELILSGFYLTDKDLNITKESELNNFDNDLAKIMFANSTPGCVIGFNKELLELLRISIPRDVPMHDLYILSVAHICGNIIAIPKRMVYYRQHGDNTEGVQSKKINIRRIIQKQKRMFSGKKTSQMSMLAFHLLEQYKEYLTPEDERFLDVVSSYPYDVRSKVKLLTTPKIYRKNIRSDLLKIETIVFNKI